MIKLKIHLLACLHRSTVFCSKRRKKKFREKNNYFFISTNNGWPKSGEGGIGNLSIPATLTPPSSTPLIILFRNIAQPSRMLMARRNIPPIAITTTFIIDGRASTIIIRACTRRGRRVRDGRGGVGTRACTRGHSRICDLAGRRATTTATTAVVR